jgi:hypothetical protein
MGSSTFFIPKDSKGVGGKFEPTHLGLFVGVVRTIIIYITAACTSKNPTRTTKA